MNIPFHKAHGARNDFLLTWADDVAKLDQDALSRVSIAICDRNAGIGADGWELLDKDGPSLRLFNPDGGEVEISGNGTRCAAALLVHQGLAKKSVTIKTGAGEKHLKLISQNGTRFEFEMDMSEPKIEEKSTIMAGYPATILNVGNPQCALIVDEIPENWKVLGAELERHPRFPKRSNISFVKVIDEHTIEARFFERGAGATMSSGTGSTGAAATAILRKLVKSPVTIQTEAGPLKFRWDDSIYLTGPAEIIAKGAFYASPK
jgi:diaminopimelate epimerase